MNRGPLTNWHDIVTTKHKKNKGFTLVEVIMTGAILAFGIVSIYEALFVSVDTHSYYVHFLSTQDWISEKIWEVQSKLINSGVIDEERTSGQIVRNHKTYDWHMVVSSMDETQGLYQVSVTLSWREGKKIVKTTRETYLMPPQLKIYNEEGSV